MERSSYWRIYTKELDKVNRNCPPLRTDNNKWAFDSTTPVYYSGRFLCLENYLAVPTFVRLGLRLEV